MPFISYKPNGRLGNNLFQYLACTLVRTRLGHTYNTEYSTQNVPAGDDWIVVRDDTFQATMEMGTTKNIYLDGFFQVSAWFLPYRDQLIAELYKSIDDCLPIGEGGGTTTIRNVITTVCPHTFQEGDVTISLRLDDFIQWPCPTSDIIHPFYYLNVLRTLNVQRLFIVMDKVKHGWEQEYLSYFSKWNPTMIQGTVASDSAWMRSAPVLIHSNSTLCWISSFLSQTAKQRFIPTTHFYKGQQLGAIHPDDTVTSVTPLRHIDVMNINSRIFPIPFAIPDELVVSTEPPKVRDIAKMVPGDRSTYLFNTQEEYYNDYKEARFAPTKKKGGWDCLRHYEILMNGCIPTFENIEGCPSSTMISFPKQIVKDAAIALSDNYSELAYQAYQQKLLDHTRKNCTTSALASYFLDMIPFPRERVKNVLLISCNCGINYTRETLWIGLKRHIRSIGGLAIEYPRMDYMYDDYEGDLTKLHGNGFTYAKCLSSIPSEYEAITNMKKSIQEKKWDLVIFGKTGPDEGIDGHLPNQPFWEDVYKFYTRNQIVFLYGGDEPFHTGIDNHYRHHLYAHAKFGTAFVRELDR